MSKRMRVILILIAVAVAGYLAYRWWQNRQGNSTGSGLGANLNSAAPELVGGSSGPDSGLNYYQGSTPITIDLPNGNQSQDDTDGDKEPGPNPPPHHPCPEVTPIRCPKGEKLVRGKDSSGCPTFHCEKTKSKLPIMAKKGAQGGGSGGAVK